MKNIPCGACGKMQKSQVCYNCRKKITGLLNTTLTPKQIVEKVVTVKFTQLKLGE